MRVMSAIAGTNSLKGELLQECIERAVAHPFSPRCGVITLDQLQNLCADQLMEHFVVSGTEGVRLGFFVEIDGEFS